MKHDRNPSRALRDATGMFPQPIFLFARFLQTVFSSESTRIRRAGASGISNQSESTRTATEPAVPQEQETLEANSLNPENVTVSPALTVNA